MKGLCFASILSRLGIMQASLILPSLLQKVKVSGVLALLFALLLAACDRRPLEVMEPTKAQIRLDVDWMTLFGYKPNGMTVMVWGDGWTKPIMTSSNNVESMKVELDPGHYRILVINKSFDEYGSIKFTDTDDFDKIAARGTNITQYQNGDWDKGVVYMPDPEDIGVACDEFTITEDMLLEQVTFYPYEEWIDRQYANTRWIQESDGTYSTKVQVMQELTRMNVWVQIKGIENMRSMVGSITGMADGFFLSQTWRTSDERPMLFEADKWTVTGADSPYGPGRMYYSMPVFGLAHGKEYVAQRKDDNNVLTLCITLVDGSQKIYTYNVGKLIKYRGLEAGVSAELHTNLETSLLLELQLDLVIDVTTVDEIPDLPNVKPDKGGSGFDAEVDPWEDGGTVDVGF